MSEESVVVPLTRRSLQGQIMLLQTENILRMAEIKKLTEKVEELERLIG